MWQRDKTDQEAQVTWGQTAKQSDMKTDRATTTPEAGRFWASKVDLFFVCLFVLTRHVTATCVVGIQPKVMSLYHMT